MNLRCIASILSVFLLSLSLPLAGCGEYAGPADDEALGEQSAAVAATGPAGTSEIILVPRGSRWGYEDTGTDQGSAWRAPTAVGPDQNWVTPWPEAAGPLGYGESYLATTLSYGPDPANKPPTVYFRRFFNVALTPRKLYLRVMYDDGFVFYINGKEGGRASMPAGPVSFSTLAASHEANHQYVTFDISAQIPNVLLADHNTLSFEVHQTSRSSSDLVFDAELLEWVDGSLQTPSGLEVPRGHYWAFWDRSAAPGAGWRDPAFDDSGWSAGPAPLGFGESYISTEISPGPITSYFRTDFYIDGPPTKMFGDVMYDDGFVAYVNGHELGRASMPAGTPTASTLAFSHEAAGFQTFDWSKALPFLVEGQLNTLAVEVHQASTTSSDLVFDLGLRFERKWEIQPVRAPGGPLHGVWFLDTARGFAVGEQGAIMTTLDGGETWAEMQSDTSEALTAIQFVDAQHGFIVGTGGKFFATANGGASWDMRTVDDGTGTKPSFAGLSFLDASHGFVIDSTSSTLYATSDGGSTWTRLPVPTGHYSDVAFADALHGWIVGGIQFENDDRGAIFATKDGGLTWTRQWVAPHHNHHLYDVQALDASTAWAVGQQSSSGVGEVLLGTHDGGTTWDWPSGGVGTGLLAIDFVDPLFGWAVGAAGGITHTEDGGATWTVQEPSRLYFKPWLEDVHFVDRSSGWAVGAFAGLGDDRGVVMHTSSGGK